MSECFSTYDREAANNSRGGRVSHSTSTLAAAGCASKEDELFVHKLLSTFVNKQSALFQRWIKLRITEASDAMIDSHTHTHTHPHRHAKSQLLVLTPLKIICLPSVQSPKRMKQFKIIDIVSVYVEQNNQQYTATNFNNPPHLAVNANTTNHRGSNTREKSHSSRSRSKAKKITKTAAKKRTKNNLSQTPPIQLIQNNVHDPNTLKYPANRSQPRAIKTGGNIKHHNTKSSSSSHSLSPPPSIEHATFQDVGAIDEDYLAIVNEAKEESRSRPSSSRSKSKSAGTQSTHTQTTSRWLLSWLYRCCIKFHTLDVLEMSYDKISSYHTNLSNQSSTELDIDVLDIYFDSSDEALEFLDILQFYLFTLYRGVPIEYKPKVEIIPNALNGDDNKYQDDDLSINDNEQSKSPKRAGKYPFIPSQVFIDRYVAYCDAQKIPALESVIDYVIHTNDTEVFSVAAAFSHHLHHLLHRHGSLALQHTANHQQHMHAQSHHQVAFSDDFHSFASSSSSQLDSYQHAAQMMQKTHKNIQQQQYVALGHALAFLKMYKKLSVHRLNTDDQNIATLMKIYETNPYIHACEFNKCAIKKITMQSLSISLSSGVANLKQLTLCDINVSRSMLKELYPGLEHCQLTKLSVSKCALSEKSSVYLFSALTSTEQWKSMSHLNISHNHCEKDGTKYLSNFIYKACNLHTLIINDARLDGNILFNGLHIQFYNASASRSAAAIKSHLDTLRYLDFSGNYIGEKGAISLSNFLQSCRSLQCLKLARCNMSTQQLHKILEGALSNCSGLEDVEGFDHDADDVDDDNEEDEEEANEDEQMQADPEYARLASVYKSPMTVAMSETEASHKYLHELLLDGDDEKKYDVDYTSDDVQSDHELITYDLVGSKSAGQTLVESPLLSPSSPNIEFEDTLKVKARKTTRIAPPTHSPSTEKIHTPSNTKYGGKFTKTAKKPANSNQSEETDENVYNNVLLTYRPTRCDLIQCLELLRLTLDISYNNLGSKGADIIFQLLRNRLLKGNIGNYTIVSLSLAGNNFDEMSLCKILENLHCCVCLESLNISDNIKQNLFSNINFSAKTKTKSKSKSKHKNRNDDKSQHDRELDEGMLGHRLAGLCRRATKLERLIFHNNDLSVGLEPFLRELAYLSNLKFIDLSNNKFNDKHITLLITALSYNRTFIRALKIDGNNRISSHCLIEYLQMLSNHTSLIDVSTCLPTEHIVKYMKVKKLNATFTRLQNEASLNLRNNKHQYDVDRKMLASLPVRERLEKELRFQCGQQFGVPLETIRGTIKFTEYAARIPQILINLRDYLQSKGGFVTNKIFRCLADANQFRTYKQDLNANNRDAKTEDMHSVANAIKDFYDDLPIKVLNNLSIKTLQSVKSEQEFESVLKLIKEPYKSLYEWLLDLCVDIVINEDKNETTHRTMAVVLCPSLYNACYAGTDILRSVSEFTEHAIQWRLRYRNRRPVEFKEEHIQPPTARNSNLINKRRSYFNGKRKSRRVNDFAFRPLAKKWNDVMQDLSVDEIEQQAWDNCVAEADLVGVGDDIDNDDDVKYQALNAERKKVQFCVCLDRLTFVLTYYKKWLKNRQINPRRESQQRDIQQLISKYNHKMHEFIGALANYGNVQLMNDFNHILRYHSSDEQLEEMANSLKHAMGACSNISQCMCMIRNNRNRDRDENRPYKMKIYFGYKDANELCTQQMLDKIHCYFFHTFDTLRLTQSEQQQIQNIEPLMTTPNKSDSALPRQRSPSLSHQRSTNEAAHSTFLQQKHEDTKLRNLKEILSPKTEKLAQIRGLHRVKGTKFSSNISSFIERINNNLAIDIDDDLLDVVDDDNKSDEEDEADDHIYQLGQTFDYWDGIESSSTITMAASPSSSNSHSVATTLPATLTNTGSMISTISPSSKLYTHSKTPFGKHNTMTATQVIQPPPSPPLAPQVARVRSGDAGASPNDWFVAKKYNNFKEEMLHNSIRQLACDSWNDCYAKALIIQKTSVAKAIKTPSDHQVLLDPPSPLLGPTMNAHINGTPAPELKLNDHHQVDEMRENPILAQHLMAVLLYCDFDNLRFSVDATYYPQSMEESVTNWKLRHAEYCHWSQYLREAVLSQTSGTFDINQLQRRRTRERIMYHSSTVQTLLSPRYLRICYPMSCNPHFSIVHTFARKNGIIYALNVKSMSKRTTMKSMQNSNECGFNCSWISDYANYDEHLIFGVNHKKYDRALLEIRNIFNVRTSQNYERYWNAVTMLYWIVHGHTIDVFDYDDKDMYCLSLLIQTQTANPSNSNTHSNGINRNDSSSSSISSSNGRSMSLSGTSKQRRRANLERLIPQYVVDLFSAFCQQHIQGEITLCPSDFIALPVIYQQLFDNFGWIKIELFCNLFINVECIQIKHFVLNENTLDALCVFLSHFYQSPIRGAIQKRQSSVMDLIATTQQSISSTHGSKQYGKNNGHGHHHHHHKQRANRRRRRRKGS